MILTGLILPILLGHICDIEDINHSLTQSSSGVENVNLIFENNNPKAKFVGNVDCSIYVKFLILLWICDSSLLYLVVVIYKKFDIISIDNFARAGGDKRTPRLELDPFKLWLKRLTRAIFNLFLVLFF